VKDESSNHLNLLITTASPAVGKFDFDYYAGTRDADVLLPVFHMVDEDNVGSFSFICKQTVGSIDVAWRRGCFHNLNESFYYLSGI